MFYSKKGRYVAKEVIELANKKDTAAAPTWSPK